MHFSTVIDSQSFQMGDENDTHLELIYNCVQFQKRIRIFQGEEQKPGSADAYGSDVHAAIAVGDKKEEHQLSSSGFVQSSSQRSWEQGQPDYQGADSFDNIMKKIDSTMSTPNTGTNLQ